MGWLDDAIALRSTQPTKESRRSLDSIYVQHNTTGSILVIVGASNTTRRGMFYRVADVTQRQVMRVSESFLKSNYSFILKK